MLWYVAALALAWCCLGAWVDTRMSKPKPWNREKP